MIWGYHYFRKHPFGEIDFKLSLEKSSSSSTVPGKKCHIMEKKSQPKVSPFNDSSSDLALFSCGIYQNP